MASRGSRSPISTAAPKTPNAFAKFEAALLHTVDLRDKRDAALKEAAAALASLEAMVESGTATRKDINAAEGEYEAKVNILVELDTRINLACDAMVAECYTAVLTSNNPEDMAKA